MTALSVHNFLFWLLSFLVASASLALSGEHFVLLLLGYKRVLCIAVNLPYIIAVATRANPTLFALDNKKLGVKRGT
jgi:hypothetical protein